MRRRRHKQRRGGPRVALFCCGCSPACPEIRTDSVPPQFESSMSGGKRPFVAIATQGVLKACFQHSLCPPFIRGIAARPLAMHPVRMPYPTGPEAAAIGRRTAGLGAGLDAGWSAVSVIVGAVDCAFRLAAAVWSAAAAASSAAAAEGGEDADSSVLATVTGAAALAGVAASATNGVGAASQSSTPKRSSEKFRASRGSSWSPAPIANVSSVSIVWQ